MIDLYYWPTPNGHKITIFLEEAGLEYEIHPVDINKGDQFKPDFLKISPNNKMPAIVDNGADGGPLSVFESGAILQYLAEKTGKFLAKDTRARQNTLQWLYWQVGGFGPMLGQANHYVKYASQLEDCDHTYSQDRYLGEAKRLYGVLDKQLGAGDYIAGDYSIADMATWPWMRAYKTYGIDLDKVPNVKRWHEAMKARPAVQKAIDLGLKVNPPSDKPLTAEAKKHMFGKK